jgi:murein DD-endopeptidase MepM/ murein hydrolase activator NlpD
MLRDKLNQQTGLQPGRRLAVLLLAVVITLSACLPTYTAVEALTSSEKELSEAKSQQSELEAEKARLAKQNAQLDKEVDKLSGQLEWLNQRSAEQRALFTKKSQQLEAAITDMEAAFAAYIRSEEVLAEKQAQYAERVRVMFDHKKQSILEIFLNARSLQGFFTTLQFMSIVADTDEQMIEDLEAAKDDAILKRDLAKQQAADMAVVVNQLKDDLAKLKADASATEAQLSQAELQLSRQEAAEDELLAEAEMVAALVATLQKKVTSEKATQAAQATAAARATAAAQSKPSNKGWTWPYPGDYNIYSPYGMRYHPIYHYYRMHTGVDLGGKYGNPIVASRSGEVILVRNPYQGRNTGGSGYGNYVVIDHGDGYCSLYAHLKETLVQVGQQVTAGQKIGLCGSTGTSTGPHLHFEIIYNGKTVDPAKFIK